jgi:hypothetical protein
MPLQSELGLVNYLRSISGVGGAGNVAVGSQAQEIDSAGLSNIMTDWLRSNGQFLQSMQQQNQAGLYNSSTRRLVANDLTAQAALKAAGANQTTRINNASNLTNASIENAKRGVAGQSGKSKLTDLALAAALNAFNGKNNPLSAENAAKKAAGKLKTNIPMGDLAMSAVGDATSYTPPEVFQNTSDPFSAQVTPGNSDYNAMLAPDFLSQAFDTGLNTTAPTDFSNFSASINTNPFGPSEGFNFDAFGSAGDSNIYNPTDFQIDTGSGINFGGEDFSFSLPDFNADFEAVDTGSWSLPEWNTNSDWMFDTGSDWSFDW